MRANCAPKYAAIAARCSQSSTASPVMRFRARLSRRIEIERVGSRHLGEPLPAVLDKPLLCNEVAPHDSEALRETLGPLEVVGERPGEVAAHVGALLNCAPQLGQVCTHVGDPTLVVYAAVLGGRVAVRAPVLRDVNRNSGIRA